MTNIDYLLEYIGQLFHMVFFLDTNNENDVNIDAAEGYNVYAPIDLDTIGQEIVGDKSEDREAMDHDGNDQNIPNIDVKDTNNENHRDVNVESGEYLKKKCPDFAPAGENVYETLENDKCRLFDWVNWPIFPFGFIS